MRTIRRHIDVMTARLLGVDTYYGADEGWANFCVKHQGDWGTWAICNCTDDDPDAVRIKYTWEVNDG